MANYSVWLTNVVGGSNSPCCGDDGASDDFYNTSLYCFQGGAVPYGEFSPTEEHKEWYNL